MWQRVSWFLISPLHAHCVFWATWNGDQGWWSWSWITRRTVPISCSGEGSSNISILSLPRTFKWDWWYPTVIKFPLRITRFTAKQNHPMVCTYWIYYLSYRVVIWSLANSSPYSFLPPCYARKRPGLCRLQSQITPLVMNVRSSFEAQCFFSRFDSR